MNHQLVVSKQLVTNQAKNGEDDQQQITKLKRDLATLNIQFETSQGEISGAQKENQELNSTVDELKAKTVDQDAQIQAKKEKIAATQKMWRTSFNILGQNIRFDFPE